MKPRRDRVTIHKDRRAGKDTMRAERLDWRVAPGMANVHPSSQHISGHSLGGERLDMTLRCNIQGGVEGEGAILGDKLATKVN
jgi:hypothetical protein